MWGLCFSELLPGVQSRALPMWFLLNMLATGLPE
jgi:hypothetical protein